MNDSTGKNPHHLVLTCMDYRHMDDLARELRSKFGHDDAYDHLVVPGACLGILQERWPEWGKAFWSQLQVAHDLHGDTIREIWLVEHMKCGAYTALLGGGTPLEHEELMHQAMAKLVEGALSEWLRRSSPTRSGGSRRSTGRSCTRRTKERRPLDARRPRAAGRRAAAPEARPLPK
jgi:carbonic anhydrase